MSTPERREYNRKAAAKSRLKKKELAFGEFSTVDYAFGLPDPFIQMIKAVLRETKDRCVVERPSGPTKTEKWHLEQNFNGRMRRLLVLRHRQFCGECGELLTADNSRVLTAVGRVKHCRPCSAKLSKEWRNTETGKSSIDAYNIRSGRSHDPDGVFAAFVEVLREVKEETACDDSWFHQANVIAIETEKIFQKYQRAFLKCGFRILQPRMCVDCGSPFETMHPTEHWAQLIYVPTGTERCIECRKRFRLANHGGGPRRRCKRFDVPYTPINPLVIYERDEWVCVLCGATIDKKLLGQPNNPTAPEMEHNWPLSVIIEGLKSPGHILENVWASHRKCNGSKGDCITQTQAESLVRKYYPNGPSVVHFDEHTHSNDIMTLITCARCGIEIVKTRPNAKYCSDRCSQAAASRRKTDQRGRKVIPEKGVCPYCNIEFKPKQHNQKFCSVRHQERDEWTRKNLKRRLQQIT